MATSFVLPKLKIIFLVCLPYLSTLVVALESFDQAPKQVAEKLATDPETLMVASTDFGRIVNEIPLGVLYPRAIDDIAALINFSNSLAAPFTVAARGQAHSVRGQAMAFKGVVVNMTGLAGNGSGRIIVNPSGSGRFGSYADVGGEQLWVDVLHATLEHGLSPVSWTDYLYLTVGGTLSNAGISGQTFRHGPQISNVYEIDVLTGKGEFLTCSQEKNSELFYAALGGLGQFGVITRARIALQPAPTRAKWVRLLYSDFSAFSGDQEHLISLDKTKKYGPDYVEGSLLLNQGALDLSFYPKPDQPRIASLVAQFGIIYSLEMVKYYDDKSHENVDKGVEKIVKRLEFVPGFMFVKDVSYDEFLNRVRNEELILRERGLWEVPHPWMNLFVPKSQIQDFDSLVLRGIILNQNLTAGLILIYPMNQNKWDDRMSAVMPDEDVFYLVGFLQSSEPNGWEAYDAQNKEIIESCEKAGIQIKQYLPNYKVQQQWISHFGSKWKVFQNRKSLFDPKYILSPGQAIFNNN